MTIVPSDLYYSNRIHHLLDGEDAADVYMSGPVLVWEHLAAGFVRPLDDLVDDTSDFFDPLLDCNRWSGPLRRPARERAAARAPGQLRVVQPRVRPGGARGGRRGRARHLGRVLRCGARRSSGAPTACAASAQRGTDAWHTMYTGFATQLWSYGGPTSRTAAARSRRPRRRRARRRLSGALRDAGPADWPDQRWYELALDFGRGRYGLIVDSDHYVAYFEDPAVSPLVGQIAYAPPPVGPTGRAVEPVDVVGGDERPYPRPDAVRRFIEWATGRSFLLRSAFEGNMNPTRRSIWDDDRFRAHTAGWGDFHDVARHLVERDASVLVTPARTTSRSRRAGSTRCSTRTRPGDAAARSRPRLLTSTRSSELLDGDRSGDGRAPRSLSCHEPHP